jgi:hypothetical protein
MAVGVGKSKTTFTGVMTGSNFQTKKKFTKGCLSIIPGIYSWPVPKVGGV